MDKIVPFDQIGLTPPGPWQNANPSAGVQGSIPNADFFTSVLGEILNTQDEAGLTRNGSDFTQNLQAHRSGKLVSFQDTGTADALVVTPRTPYTTLGLGAEIVVLKGSSANATISPTLQVSALTRPILKEDGTALAAGDLPAGALITFRYDGSSAFRVVGLRKSDTTPTIPAAALWHFASDSSTDASKIVASGMYPAAPAVRASAAYMIYAGHACTGATQVDVGFGLGPLVRTDGSPLQAGDYVSGHPLLIIDDGYSRYQLADLTPAQIITLLRTARFVVDSGTNDALVVTPNPPIAALVFGQELIVKRPTGVANLSGTPTIAVSGLSAVTVVRRDGGALQAGDLGGNTITPMVYDGAQFRLTSFARSQVKQKLTGPLLVYVRPDGNDGNDGSANTAAKAYATLVGAWSSLFKTYDTNGFPITVTLGVPGTYVGCDFNGSASVIALNTAGGGTYTVTDPGNGVAYAVASSGSRVTITGITFNFVFTGTALSNECNVLARSGGGISLVNCTTNMNNSRAGFSDIIASDAGSQISMPVGQTLTITGSGGRAACFSEVNGGQINGAGTITVSGSFTITGIGFCTAQAQSRSQWQATINGSGTVTGPSYGARLQSFINTGGAGAGYFPGSMAGTVDPSSQYI